MNWFKIVQLVLQYLPVLAQMIREIVEAFEQEPVAVQKLAKQNLENVLAKKDVDGLKTLCAIHGDCQKLK